MNNELLKKYNIVFGKTVHGEKSIICSDRISCYLYVWKLLDDIDDFLIDINHCLSGNIELVKDRGYDEPVLNLLGELTPDTLIISEKEGMHDIIVPLAEFKELLLSWKEYLLQ